MGLFDFFSKNEFKYVPSEYFLNHYLKDMYFYRTMPFSKMNDGNIVAYDPNAPRVITFDPWPQQIFLNATGQITVEQYLNNTANLYCNNVPELLDKFIIDEFGKTY
ncbi:hypothetical protein [Mucilaginibacter terrae]|uniref:Uncharacterized protein n=1 Tax=Mucilaginibacter terrae TaxID=1955052 RepID=A0ABU3GUV4_9SPHI|nr:hypothetical protein [Mucilaginibacter terrae]MDT3403553.1 hypothetical protein [Mucilaginibacter terrae]